MKSTLWIINTILAAFSFAAILFYSYWLKWLGGFDQIGEKNEVIVISAVASSSLAPLAFAVLFFKIWQANREANKSIPSKYPEIASLRLQTKAVIIDGLLFSPLLLIRPFYYPKTATIMLVILSLRLLPMLYNVIFDCTTGATLGKKRLNIRTMRVDGQKLSFWSALIRALPTNISTLLVIGLLIHFRGDLQWIIEDWTDFQGLEYGLSQNLPLFEIFLNTAYVLSALNILVLALNPRRRSLSDILSGAVVRINAP